MTYLFPLKSFSLKICHCHNDSVIQSILSTFSISFILYSLWIFFVRSFKNFNRKWETQNIVDDWRNKSKHLGQGSFSNICFFLFYFFWNFPQRSWIARCKRCCCCYAIISSSFCWTCAHKQKMWEIKIIYKFDLFFCIFCWCCCHVVHIVLYAADFMGESCSSTSI